ncbi:transposase [Streptomyces parvus]|nr:transposase [Streptomyces parvus]MCQ1582568.1 transposase [Streptomyces parvus]
MGRGACAGPAGPAHAAGRRPTAPVIDDTGFPEDGDAPVCVARQCTGTAGKAAGCRAEASLHLASNGARTAVNRRLFLPGSRDPASPEADPAAAARRDTCVLPARVGRAEQWRPALGMTGKARPRGIEVPRVIADRGYGHTAAFRSGPQERGPGHVVGISTTTTAQPGNAQPCTPARSGRGPHPAPACPAPARQVTSPVITAGTSSARPECGGGRDRGRAADAAGSHACTRASWQPCGSVPPDVRSARPHRAAGFRFAGCRPKGPPTRTNPCGSRSPACPQPPAARPRAHREAPPAHRERPPREETEPETTTEVGLLTAATSAWPARASMTSALGPAHVEGRTRPGPHHHVTPVPAAHALCTLQRPSRSPKETASAWASTASSASCNCSSRPGPAPAPATHRGMPDPAPA